MVLLAGAKFVFMWRFVLKMLFISAAKCVHAAAAWQPRRKMTQGSLEKNVSFWEFCVHLVQNVCSSGVEVGTILVKEK